MTTRLKITYLSPLPPRYSFSGETKWSEVMSETHVTPPIYIPLGTVSNIVFASDRAKEITQLGFWDNKCWVTPAAIIRIEILEETDCS